MKKMLSIITLSAIFAVSNLCAKNEVLSNHKELAEKVLSNYSSVVYQTYLDSFIGAEMLNTKIQRFVTLAKTAKKQEDVQELKSLYTEMKTLWANQARIPYGQSEAFRFYNGPIDFEPVDDGNDTHLEEIGFVGVEGLLNAWPLDEAYIDYVKGNPNSGIVNNRSLKLTSKLILSMNEQNGEKNISTGYHAIEFLLWGQDRSLSSAGTRSYTDYLNTSSAKNQDRRGQYLSLVSTTLLGHLKSVLHEWRPASVNYRQEFQGQKMTKSLSNIFTSMIAMIGDELKSERIENAFLLGDQEEEHSCFSDKTINDIYANAKGVMNTYFGVYTPYNTTASQGNKKSGINQLVGKVDSGLNTLIEKKFTEVMDTIFFFYNKDSKGKVLIGDIKIPFDKALTSNKKEIQKVIDRLDELDKLLRQAASKLGLSIEI